PSHVAACSGVRSGGAGGAEPGRIAATAADPPPIAGRPRRSIPQPSTTTTRTARKGELKDKSYKRNHLGLRRIVQEGKMDLLPGISAGQQNWRACTKISPVAPPRLDLCSHHVVRAPPAPMQNFWGGL